MRRTVIIDFVIEDHRYKHKIHALTFSLFICFHTNMFDIYTCGLDLLTSNTEAVTRATRYQMTSK